jgi:PKD repeat protein
VRPGGPPNNVYGWGRIDAYAAVESVYGPLDIPWVWEDPISGTVPPTSTQLVDVSFMCTITDVGQILTGTLRVFHNDPCEPPIDVMLEFFCRECEPVDGADFTWMPITPTAGGVVTFTGSVMTGTTPMTYTWDFGDGFGDVGQMVNHTYANTGTYTVMMTVTNDCGVDTAMYDIVVVEPPPCQPVEIVTVTTAISGCVVDFGAVLNGDAPFTYTWDFGPFGSSDQPTPTVDFGADGTYPFDLWVWNCDGVYSDTYSGDVTVSCGVCAPVTNTQFSWMPITPTVGEMVTFNASAEGSTPITFTWDFGDGATGMGAMVTHTYMMTGTYNVTLTATNCGTATETVVDTITVVEAPVQMYYLYLPVIFKNY